MTNYQTFINNICANDATVEAVTVGVTLYNWTRGAAKDAIDSGRIVRRWWDATGENYAWTAARYVGLTLMIVACVLCAAWVGAVEALKIVERTWVKYGTLDGAGPMLGSVPERVVIDAPEGAESAGLTEWAFARYGRLQGELPEVSGLVQWAQTLKA